MGTISGISGAKQLTGWGCSTTHQQIGCFKTFWAHNHPWTWPCPLEGQESGPRHQCAGIVIATWHCSQRPEDQDPYTSGQAPDSESPELRTFPPASLLYPGPASSSSKPTPALGLTGPRFIHQQANPSFRIPQTLQLGESGTSPTHQWSDNSPGSPEHSHACQSSGTRPRNWDHPLVDRHKFWDVLNPRRHRQNTFRHIL